MIVVCVLVCQVCVCECAEGCVCEGGVAVVRNNFICADYELLLMKRNEHLF